MATADTKQSILDAAEKIFAKQGFDAASLRAITQEAGVNIAAVNYHFGSKEGLLQALMTRRLEPLKAERLARLEAVLAGDAPPTVEAICEAFVGPAIEMAIDPATRASDFLRLLGRLHVEPVPAAEPVFHEQFCDTFERFAAALAAALPELPPTELSWRLYLAIGSFVHLIIAPKMMPTMVAGLDGASAVNDSRGLIPRLVGFMAAGLKAPLVTE